MKEEEQKHLLDFLEKSKKSFKRSNLFDIIDSLSKEEKEQFDNFEDKLIELIKIYGLTVSLTSLWNAILNIHVRLHECGHVDGRYALEMFLGNFMDDFDTLIKRG